MPIPQRSASERSTWACRFLGQSLHHCGDRVLRGRLNRRIGQRISLAHVLRQHLGELCGGRIRGDCAQDGRRPLWIRGEQVGGHESEHFGGRLDIGDQSVGGDCRQRRGRHLPASPVNPRRMVRVARSAVTRPGAATLGEETVAAAPPMVAASSPKVFTRNHGCHQADAGGVE